LKQTSLDEIKSRQKKKEGRRKKKKTEQKKNLLSIQKRNGSME
jgi:hypothetical protein